MLCRYLAVILCSVDKSSFATYQKYIFFTRIFATVYTVVIKIQSVQNNYNN